MCLKNPFDKCVYVIDDLLPHHFNLAKLFFPIGYNKESQVTIPETTHHTYVVDPLYIIK